MRDTRRAMSQANLELVHGVYDSWNRVDLEALLAVMHPDVEIRTSGVFPGLEPI